MKKKFENKIIESFFRLIFAISKFRNIGRSTFRRSKFWPPPMSDTRICPVIELTRFRIPSRFTSFRVIASSFFKNGILKKLKKNWKNSYGFWKMNKFIWNEKRINNLIIYWTVIFFTNLLITFRHYYYTK